VVLLLGAALLIRSFLHLARVDPGFTPDHVLTFELDSPAEKTGRTPATFYREVITRVRTIPGVKLASAVASLPLTGDNISSGFELQERPAPLGSRPIADFNAVEPGYFRTLGIAITRGRDFSEYDNEKSTPVAMVNRALAEQFFPNQDPIGRRIRPGIGNGYGSGEPPMREIVGVISDVKQSGLNTEAQPEIYVPIAQSPFSPMFIVLRTANDPEAMANTVRRCVAAIDKNDPIYNVRTLDQYFANSLLLPRLVTGLLSGFAGLALLLACIGVYGVVSYVTSQRTHEIGIRVALGAHRRDILRMVVGEGLGPILLGLVIGIGIALKAMRVLSSLIFGLTPRDPATFVAVSLVLAGIAVIAAYIPAERAAKLDPTISLRHQ
jgi:putative ABC transport system permease protein